MEDIVAETTTQTDTAPIGNIQNIEQQIGELHSQMTALRREVTALRRQRWAGAGLLMAGLLVMSIPYARTQDAISKREIPPYPVAQAQIIPATSATGVARIEPVPTSAAAEPVLTTSQELVCRSLKIVNEQGKVAMILAANSEGGTLSIRDQAGKPSAVVYVGTHGGKMELYGKDGKARFFQGVDNNGGLVRLFGNDGKVRLQSSVERFGGQLVVAAANGEDRFRSGVAVNDTGLVQIMGKDQKPRATIGVLKDKGALVVLDNRGRILKVVP